MVKRRCITAAVLLLLSVFSQVAHTHTYKISVLVDTDMALDDIRSLAMLLNSDMVDIPLIVTSDGVVSPDTGCQNLKILLHYFKQRDIPTARGRVLGKQPPPWRSWSTDINWPLMEAGAPGRISCQPAAEAIVQTLQSQDQRILYLCLGPLTNLADALRLKPDIRDKISRLVYFGAHPEASFPGWNTAWDPEAAQFVFESGLEIYATVLPEKELLHFDERLYNRIKEMDTAAARLVAEIHDTPVLSMLLADGRFYVWDEMLVIYMNRPSLFRFVRTAHGSDVMALKFFKREESLDTYLKLLGFASDFHLSPRHSVVLKDFPSDPELFREDMKPYVTRVIEKHGLEEWKACLLTNEFHRHLGIYSLIGAKMGVRARETLEAPFDALKVVSFAGNGPPLSCMNDGLQVSTGASLGRGTIQVPDGRPMPAASFFFKDKKLTLSLKASTVERVKGDIKKAVKRFGGLNPEYFAHIRELAIRYWFDLNRQDIFDEVIE